MPNIRLEPLGRNIAVARGANLEDILFPVGVEFPCGGDGTCGGCRVKLLSGPFPITDKMRDQLTEAELDEGWRLACCGSIEEDVTLEVGQWSSPVLTDDQQVGVEPRPGCGAAIDLGTTTIAAQLLDLRTGHVLSVRTALNPQCVYGSDIMTRVESCLRHDEAALRLRDGIRTALGGMVTGMLTEAGRADLVEVNICGNTVMQHLFAGWDVTPLSQAPFEPEAIGMFEAGGRELGWDVPNGAAIRFLPAIGGFVGSDVVAGIVAMGIAESEHPVALLDLGTNGEVVVGDASGLVCASAAAGPAFEAGKISMGMRAAEGAIAHVRWRKQGLECRVIGGGAARGLCGSGLVSAAAAGLDGGAIEPSGRIRDGSKQWTLQAPVRLTQADIRQLQLAKGAIQAGVRLLARHRGWSVSDLRHVYLAGAFGNYIDVRDACRIGLTEVPAHRVQPAGNSALRGVKWITLNPSRRGEWLDELPKRIRHIGLHTLPGFQDEYAACMRLGSAA